MKSNTCNNCCNNCYEDSCTCMDYGTNVPSFTEKFVILASCLINDIFTYITTGKQAYNPQIDLNHQPFKGLGEIPL